MVTEVVVDAVATQTPAFPEAMTWPEKAKALKITDQTTYDLAGNQKRDLAALRRKIVAEFGPMKEAAYKAHKVITTKEAEYLAPITEAEGIIAKAIKLFEAEQERIRLEIEERRREQQRKDEEAERLRREAEARAVRDAELKLQAEQRAREEEERIALALKAEAAGAAAVEVETILAQPVREIAEVLELEAYIDPTPVYAAPVVAAPTYDRMKGLNIRENWSARVDSVKELARAVADGRIPETYITPNMTALNARARSDKKLLNIPGVTAVVN